MSPLEALRGGLIVSCQAQAGEPLHGSAHMAAMARAAAMGGAVGIRAESPEDLRAIRAAVGLPLVGLWKRGSEGVYITPDRASARAVAEAGADLVALDATMRPRPEPLPSLIAHVRGELGRAVLADVSTLEEGLAAEAWGADAVAPTLSGYTEGSPMPEGGGPAWDLLEALLARLRVPVIMEGRIWTPAEARRALDLGAWAVVVGSAISRPQLVTARFAQALVRGPAGGPAGAPSKGPPSAAPSSSDDGGETLGIDLGGTKILAGALAADGRVLATWRRPTDASRGAPHVLDALSAVIAEALAERPSIQAVGVASAGEVDWETGAIGFATDNLPGWSGTPLAATLAARHGLPVCADNDANAAAYGEFRRGAGRGSRSLAVLTLGTGVGGGLVIDGRPLRGAHHQAGELGHAVVSLDGRPCVCGQAGCLEAYASGTAIAAMAREARPGWAGDAAAVFALASEGDPAMRAVLRTAARALAAGLLSLARTLDPERVLLGGGVASQPGFLPLVRAQLDSQAGGRLIPPDWLGLCALGEAAGMIGAAEPARSRYLPASPPGT